MNLFKKVFNKSAPKKQKVESVKISRQDLERKVVDGARKAVKDYSRVFERLAEYDRT